MSNAPSSKCPGQPERVSVVPLLGPVVVHQSEARRRSCRAACRSAPPGGVPHHHHDLGEAHLGGVAARCPGWWSPSTGTSALGRRRCRRSRRPMPAARTVRSLRDDIVSGAAIRIRLVPQGGTGVTLAGPAVEGIGCKRERPGPGDRGQAFWRFKAVAADSNPRRREPSRFRGVLPKPLDTPPPARLPERPRRGSPLRGVTLEGSPPHASPNGEPAWRRRMERERVTPRKRRLPLTGGRHHRAP